MLNLKIKTIKKGVLKMPAKHINGVKIYYVAGSWYCDYNHYQQARMQQGVKPNIDVFMSWCDRWDLCPTG